MSGAGLLLHLHALDRLSDTGLATIARLPGLLEGQMSIVAAVAASLWAGAIGLAVTDYRRAMADGYRLPPHKLALIVTTGFVLLIAWGFSSPLIALVSINIYHAVQYFALVWLKEGARMTAMAAKRKWAAAIVFGGLCALFGIAYSFAAPANIRWFGAIFLACSILHFRFYVFVWSVRKRQVWHAGLRVTGVVQ